MGKYCYVASARRRARCLGAHGAKGAGAYCVATRTACYHYYYCYYNLQQGGCIFIGVSLLAGLGYAKTTQPIFLYKIRWKCGMRTTEETIRLWWIDLVFALKTHKTIMFHEFAPNLVNVHFPTQDQSFGTIYPWTSVLNQTLRVSRTFLRHTFFRLAFDLLG